MKINDLTTKLNDQVRGVVDELAADGRNVQYISITESFAGHRFCEWDSNIFSDRYGSDDVKADQMFNATYMVDSQSQESKDFWNWKDLFNFDKALHDYGNFIIPFQGASPGVALRPFHPTEQGHTAIKDALKAQMKIEAATKSTSTSDLLNDACGTLCDALPVLP
ncbi:hypothetical protein LTR95_015906 [Oleoguttula sp. CCFEE 5521]